MKTIIYTRTSTATQDISLAVQADACINYCKAKGWTNYRVIEEKESAKTMNRPFFNQILEMVEAGKVERLIVFKLDRLSRRLKHIIELVEHFKEKGVEFVSIQENFDTSTPQGMAFLQITGVFAELERNMISERTRLALAQRKKEGVQLGRPLGNYEYHTKRHRLAARVRSMRKGRKMWKDICEELNINFRTAKACLSTK